MKVTKNGKTYIIKECKNHWSVSEESAAFSLCFNVDKEICKTEADIIEYVNNNDLF